MMTQSALVEVYHSSFCFIFINYQTFIYVVQIPTLNIITSLHIPYITIPIIRYFYTYFFFFISFFLFLKDVPVTHQSPHPIAMKNHVRHSWASFYLSNV